MKEYQCDKCGARFLYPRDSGGFLVCAECGDGAIFPVHPDRAPHKTNPTKRRAKRGAQIGMFGKEDE